MSTSLPRVVFLGTPAFAVRCLHALRSVAEVVAVVCQPDRASGRGLALQPPPVKATALELGLPVHQPTKMKDGTFAAWLREQRAELAVVVAYGRILPPEVLAAPARGCLNVHASLLPRWRGAAPINHALLAGDTRSGVCLMQMDAGLDTGPVLASRELAIGSEERADELYDRLSQLGAELLLEELPRYFAGQLTATAQQDALVTLAPPLTKEQAHVDWTRSATALHNQLRGLQPWPGASTTLGTRRLMLHRSTLEGAPTVLAGAPGEVVAVTRERLWVATGQGVLGLTEVQLEGKRRIGIRDFLSGHPVRPGTLLGT